MFHHAMGSSMIFVLIATLTGFVTCPSVHNQNYNAPTTIPAEVDESRKAVCVLQSSDPNTKVVYGTINITQISSNEPVFIDSYIKVYTHDNMNGEHGFHIHTFGVPNGGLHCKDAAGHYNPFGKDHGGPDVENRHVGDLGNILMRKSGDGLYCSSVKITDSQVTLFGDYSVAGRAFVLHQGEDDLGLGGEDDSHKTGHAGARIACCTINMVPFEE